MRYLFAVADRQRDAFASLNLRMGRGRTPEDKRKTAQALLDTARNHFAPVLEFRYVGIALQVDEGRKCSTTKMASSTRWSLAPKVLSTETIKELALKLQTARKSRVQLRHFSRDYPTMTIEDGYAIQQEWVQLELAEGRTIRGRKIGLTSRAMQQASQITEPDYAPLMDDMFFETGSDIPLDRFIAPRVEVELAFLLKEPLRGPDVVLADVLRATAYVQPALEIIDARIEQFDRESHAPRKVLDTIADFAANAGIVLGGRPIPPDSTDLRWVGALLYKNGVIEETGLAAGVLNHPATGVAWLANKISVYSEQLWAGDVVLGGSFTRPTVAVRGDVIHADYGPLGNVSFRFV